MKYLLKLASGEGKGYFETVDKFAFDNHKFALADDGVSPRYEVNDWAVLGDDGTLSLQLQNANPQDLAILIRGLQLPQASPAKVDGGFIREPMLLKFHKGNSIKIWERQTGLVYTATQQKKVA